MSISLCGLGFLRKIRSVGVLKQNHLKIALILKVDFKHTILIKHFPDHVVWFRNRHVINKLHGGTRGLIFVVGVGASRPYFRQLPRVAFCAFSADTVLAVYFRLLTEPGLKRGAYR